MQNAKSVDSSYTRTCLRICGTVMNSFKIILKWSVNCLIFQNYFIWNKVQPYPTHSEIFQHYIICCFLLRHFLLVIVVEKSVKSIFGNIPDGIPTLIANCVDFSFWLPHFTRMQSNIHIEMHSVISKALWFFSSSEKCTP